MGMALAQSRLTPRIAVLALMIGSFCLRGEDAPPNPIDPAAAAFFENKIRPLLAANCYQCHGPEKTRGELRVDSLSALIQGGDSGPAVVPGNPAESLLIQAINYESYEMPPSGKLDDEKIALLTEWVRMGAPWPGSAAAPSGNESHDEGITDEDRQFWAFVPPQSSNVPVHGHVEQMRNPLDAFIVSKLASKGLELSPVASRRTLARRLSYDLCGLPPTRDEVDTFSNDRRPDAYERLVDRMLASPRFGERWGRHWLDVARFAQTNGYERDAEKPFSWRYRDYVVDSFNADKPYDVFVREQIAGDEMSSATDESVVATGFARLGVWDDEPDDKENATFEYLDDMVSTTGSAILGLTVGCARCHDHRFDPISQKDYYGLVAFFRNVREYEKYEGGKDKKDFAMLAPLSNGEAALAVRESGPVAPETHLLIRGDAHTPSDVVPPKFVEVLCPTTEDSLPSIATPSEDATTSGRRTVLAQWLTQPNHPLTSRVIANRLWHHHFGRGIVSTPSDFGETGSRPTHPELLDWLATELVETGWGMKHLHRLILESAAYRQSSNAANEQALAVDPDNQLLWRQSLRRAEAEAMRDTLLSANGRLNLEMGGRGFFPTLPKEVLSTQSLPGNGWDESKPDQQARRSLYMFVKRTLKVPVMETFDAANPDQTIASRQITTIAPQALLWLNSSLMNEESLAMADRLNAEAPGDVRGQIEKLFSVALQREPSAEEMKRCLEFLGRQYAGWHDVGEPAIAEDPLREWIRFGGHWKSCEGGGLAVEPEPGSKIIWPENEVVDGVVEGEIMLSSDTGDAGLLVRVQDATEGVDSLRGYNINLSASRLRIGKHENNWQELLTVPLPISTDAWHHLRIELAGSTIRVTLDHATEPTAEVSDPAPLPKGQVGFRTFQARAAVRNITVTTPDVTWVAGSEEESSSQESAMENAVKRRAMAGLAKLIFNTNEFIYID